MTSTRDRAASRSLDDQRSRAHAKRLVAEAPPLSPQQLADLRTLLNLKRAA